MDLWERLKSRVLEDPYFNSLKEHYETLPSTAQKSILIGTTLLFFLFLIYIPFGYFQAANEYEEKYNTYRSALRDLLKTGKPDQVNALSTQRGDLEGLKSRIANKLNNFNLMNGQIQPVEVLQESTGSLARPPIQEEVFLIKLNKLNLDQILQIGSDINRSFSDLKMTGISLTADKEKADYFNTEYRLSKFYLPGTEDAESTIEREEKPADKRPQRRFQRK